MNILLKDVVLLQHVGLFNKHVMLFNSQVEIILSLSLLLRYMTQYYASLRSILLVNRLIIYTLRQILCELYQHFVAIRVFIATC